MIVKNAFFTKKKIIFYEKKLKDLDIESIKNNFDFFTRYWILDYK